MDKLSLFVLLSLFSFSSFSYEGSSNDTVCNSKAAAVERDCLQQMEGIGSTDEERTSTCKARWTQAFEACKRESSKQSEGNCNPMRQVCDSDGEAIPQTIDPNARTQGGESCQDTCMKTWKDSAYCQAQCSRNASGSRNRNVESSSGSGNSPTNNRNTNGSSTSRDSSVNRTSNSLLQDTPGGGIPSGGGGGPTTTGSTPGGNPDYQYERPAPPPPREPNLNQSVINAKFASCFRKESSADECCNTRNSEMCVRGIPEGDSLLTQLTQQANGLKATQGMQNQCNAVKNLQKTNLAFTVMAREQCKSKKDACSSDCNEAYYSVSHIYNRECLGLEYHPNCQELKRGLDEAKGSEQNCQGMSENGNHFVAGMAQDLSKIKVAQECEDALKEISREGTIMAAVPLPSPSDHSQTLPNCHLAANRSHPSCLENSFGKLGSRDLIEGFETPSTTGRITVGSRESSSESDSPPGFDPQTGKAIPGYNEKQEAQYLARLENFESQQKKLNSHLAKGSSSGGGGGLLGGGSGSGSFQPLPGAPGVNPHKSDLFKEAASQSGYSQSGGRWSSGRSIASVKQEGLGFSDIFSKLKTNSEKPRNLNKTNGFNLRSLFGSFTGQHSHEIGSDQWLFGVNSKLLFQFFKEGESKLNFPAKPLTRATPHSDFPGLSYLKENNDASKRYHCTHAKSMRKENILDVNLPPVQLKKRVQSLNSWLIYNINRDQNCFNRKKVTSGINANLFGQPLAFETFKKEEYFDHSYLKMNYHRGFRDDEKKPLWIFSNNTDEMFFTMLVKKVDPAVDNLKTYRLYMNNFIYYKLPNRVQKKSRPVQVMNQKIKGQEWVDGLHYESEAEGYFTRYLSTVYKGKAILVTFNIKKEALQKYIHPMNRMIASFRLDPNFVPTDYMDEGLQVAALGKGSQMITLGQAKKFPGKITKSYLQYKERKKFISRATSFLLGLGCLLLAGLGYFLVRRKQKNENSVEKKANLRELKIHQYLNKKKSS